MSYTCKRCVRLRTARLTPFRFIAISLSSLIVLCISLGCKKSRWQRGLSDQWTIGVYQKYLGLSRDLPSSTETFDCPPPASAPTPYVITPTHTRLTQEADLLRLCYTLMHVPHVRWILVEDSDNKTELVCRVLRNCQGPNITHLTARSLPPEIILPTNNTLPRHRGVSQRNMGLLWIRRCVLTTSRAGGVYFADDDNTYSIRVFDVVRKTRRLAVWKVGLAGGLLEEGPVCFNNTVVRWRSAWAPDRKYPIDMAGFAVGLNLLAVFPAAKFSHEAEPGHLESAFLTLFNISATDITPAPDHNCSKVLAWHTKTSTPNIAGEQELAKSNVTA